MQAESSKSSFNELKKREVANQDSNYQELHSKQLEVVRKELFLTLTGFESKSSSVWTDFKNDIKSAFYLAAILQYIAIVGTILLVVLLFIRK